jgi:hypothetical protein
MSKEKASELFTIRITPLERELLDNIAASTGETASAVIKRLIHENATGTAIDIDYRARGLAAIMRARLEHGARIENGKGNTEQLPTDKNGAVVIPCEGALLTFTPKDKVYCYSEKGMEYPITLAVE